MDSVDHGCTVRLARRSEAQAIAVMSRDHIESGLGWGWTAARIVRCMADRETNVVVAARGHVIDGFALMSYGAERAHLLLFAVAADRRRRGVGTTLWGWLEQTALVAGMRRVELEVRAANAVGRAFYQRLGFVERATVPGYYGGREAAIRMQIAVGRPAGTAPRAH